MSLPASNTSPNNNACSTTSSLNAQCFEADCTRLQQELKQTQDELKQARTSNQSLSEKVLQLQAENARNKLLLQKYERDQSNITNTIVSVFNRCVVSFPQLGIAKALAEKELQELMAIASAPDLTSMWLNKLLDELGAQAAKNIDLRRQRRNGNLSESNRHKTRKYQVEPEQDDVDDTPDVGTEDDGAEKSTVAKPKSTRKPVDTSKIYKLTPTFDEEILSKLA